MQAIYATRQDTRMNKRRSIPLSLSPSQSRKRSAVSRKDSSGIDLCY